MRSRNTASKGRVYWEQLYQEHQHSGLNAKEFCAAHGIAPSTFWGWCKKIEQTIPTTVVDTKKKIKKVTAKKTPFIRVATNRAKSSTIRVMVNDGIIVELVDLPDPHWLAQIINLCGVNYQ